MLAEHFSSVLSFVLVTTLVIFSQRGHCADSPALSPPPKAQPATAPSSTPADTPPGTTESTPVPPVTAPAGRLPEVVVTAERLATNPDDTGVSTTVINGKEEDEVRQVHDLSETLRQVPGITISQSGKQGDFTTLSTRGGNSNQTLLLIDGFKVNRQGGNFDIGHLDPVGAGQIEIARGPASSLFGTDAVTGVIGINTAKGEGRPDVTISGAGGTYGTDRETLSTQGSEGKFSYNLSASRLNRDQAEYANSALQTYNYAARLDYDFNADHTLKFIARGSEFKKGFYEDSATGYGQLDEPADPNDRLQSDDLLVGLEYKGTILPIWTTTLRAGNYLYDQDSNSLAPNPVSPVGGFSQSLGSTFTRERRPSVDWQNDITAYSTEDGRIKDIVTAGLNFEDETFHQVDTQFGNNADVSRSNWSVFMQNRLSLYDRAFITGGVRREQNQQFGEFTTGRADVAVLVPESDTRIHGSVGNAFRAPSFFEFFSSIGNPNLKPEKNFAGDAGVDQSFLNKRVTVGATAFKNSFNDLIDFDVNTSKFSNLKTAETEGVELQAAADPIKELTLRATTTLMHTEDAAGASLLRRPKRTSTAEIIARPLTGFDLSFTWLSEGSRADLGPQPANPFGRVSAAAFSRLDIAASYRFLSHYRVFGRIQNALNEKYDDAKTFPAAGSNFLGGFEFHWGF